MIFDTVKLPFLTLSHLCMSLRQLNMKNFQVTSKYLIH